jgi:hypothetical protein
MKRNYYFLAASLPELVRGRTQSVGSVQHVWDRCAHELHPDDFDSLKSLFLLNDIANAVSYRRPGDRFLSPSFYSPEELIAGLKEPERLLPFLAQHHANTQAGVRLRPEMRETDEVTLLFYMHLGDIRDAFAREYHLHQLDVRNIAVALELRQQSLPLEGNLIPMGVAYEMITASSAEDFGLSDAFPYVPRLLAAYRQTSLTKREQVLDEILWEWLQDRLGSDYFSSDYVLGYLLKLGSVERWHGLREESGSVLFEELLNTVHRSVRFAIEFSKIDQGGAA